MKTAIVTLCCHEEKPETWVWKGDELDAVANLTHPTIKAYASRIGADFHVITKRKYQHPVNMCYEKLQVRDYLDHYDRVLYLDTDVLVRKDTPNLFEIVPWGFLGAVVHPKERLGNIMSLNTVTEGALKHFDVPYSEKHLGGKYFNAGVYVCDRTHRDLLFNEPKEFHDVWGEQTWMNIQAVINEVPLFELPYTFNHFYRVQTATRLDSYIIHYTSFHRLGQSKAGYIEEDIEAWRSIYG